jgi:ABC-type Fe3+-hydroxamate transport system substrate-binding protein
MFKKKLLTISGGLILSAAITGVAQNTTTKTTTTTTTSKTAVVQNADGSYSVIEYPVGKEVMVDLTPGMNLTGAKGRARVMRMGNETMINLDLSGLPADASNYYVYAVDPAGTVTLLGPTSIANGASQVRFTTPMDKFMLVLSPNEGLSSFNNDTPVVFRSAVPQGYAVVGNRPSSSMNEDKQVAMSAPVSSTYEVPLLGVQSFSGKTTETRINFTGDLQGLKGKAYIKARKDGTAQIKMRFDDLKMAPKQKRYVLWAVSPEKAYTKIGQIINTGARQEGEIRGETALKDFGLFVTIEEADVTQPTSTMYSTFTLRR